MTYLADERESSAPIEFFLDQRIFDLPNRLLDLLPIGVYVCDQDGSDRPIQPRGRRTMGLFPEYWRSDGSIL